MLPGGRWPSEPGRSTTRLGTAVTSLAVPAEWTDASAMASFRAKVNFGLRTGHYPGANYRQKFHWIKFVFPTELLHPPSLMWSKEEKEFRSSGANFTTILLHINTYAKVMVAFWIFLLRSFSKDWYKSRNFATDTEVRYEVRNFGSRS
jgi:hypothetical protein